MSQSPTKLSDLAVTGNLTVGGTQLVDGVVTDDATFAAGKQVRLDSGTATATSGAATLNKQAGVITSESLTTAAAAAYTLTITNSLVAAGSIVLASVQSGTNTQGVLSIDSVTPDDGSVVIVVRNRHASQALNGTIKVSFVVINGAAA
jgi:exosome complex RNA-binding protein Csl4